MQRIKNRPVKKRTMCSSIKTLGLTDLDINKLHETLHHRWGHQLVGNIEESLDQLLHRRAREHVSIHCCYAESQVS